MHVYTHFLSQELITAHVESTGSEKGKAILGDWANALGKFWQLVPPSEASTPEASKVAEEESVVTNTTVVSGVSSSS